MINVSHTISNLAIGLFFITSNVFAADTFTPYKEGEVPQSTQALWNSYDPRIEALDVKVIKEWKEDNIVSRYITFTVGTFKGVPARISAYYVFPENTSKNPAFVWCHGGGQRAVRDRGVYFAKQGYATVDINWLGRPIEEDTKVNTNWGKVDPTQGKKFYSKALRNKWKLDLLPDKHTIDAVPSPRNCNWFLLCVAGRRAITFLEQQTEVDKDKIGFSGFSMGGMVTSMTATDKRLKAVAPFVGGNGFNHVDFPGMPHSSYATRLKNLELYKNTLDTSSYWPLVKCPVMFISSSNDFHSAFDRNYKSMALLKHKNWRITTNIHDNHRPSGEQWILLNKWFDIYLKGTGEALPETPPTTFSIKENTATLTVSPKSLDSLVNTEVYYSYDPNPLTRFWNKAKAVKDRSNWVATIKIHDKLPLYTFAICRYKMEDLRPLQNGGTQTYTINSLVHIHMPKDFDINTLSEISKKETYFEDFTNGIQDWNTREGSIMTYKFQNPEFEIRNDQKLKFTIDSKGRKLSLILNFKSKFLKQGNDLGDCRVIKPVSNPGIQEIIIGLNALKFNNTKKAEWSKISRFQLMLKDAETKETIDLSKPENLSYLKSIQIVD